MQRQIRWIVSLAVIAGILLVLTLQSPAGKPESTGPEVTLGESMPDGSVAFDLLRRPASRARPRSNCWNWAENCWPRRPSPMPASRSRRNSPPRSTPPIRPIITSAIVSSATEAFRQRSLQFLSRNAGNPRPRPAGVSRRHRARSCGSWSATGRPARPWPMPRSACPLTTATRRSAPRGQDRRPRRSGSQPRAAGRWKCSGARLKVNVQSRTGRDTIEETVQVKSARPHLADHRQAALPAGPDDPHPRPGLAAAEHGPHGRGRRGLRGRGRQGQQGLQASRSRPTSSASRTPISSWPTN